MEPVKSGAMRVLSLNCGSSSLKFGVFEVRQDSVQLLFEGEAEEIGKDGSGFWVRSAQEESKRSETVALKDHGTAVQRAMDALNKAQLRDVDAVGHRIVHGGPKLRQHHVLDESSLRHLKEALPFAPLHLPTSLAAIDAISKLMPTKPQVVCLDTAFHSHMPDVAKTFALPAEVRGMGVERFGFHGISLESILAQLENIPERLVVAHLGNGSSITAIHQGRSIDTSMGLTPTGGVMMGSRTGDLDPGILIYLMRHGYADADRMEQLIDHQAGLTGVSGGVSDVRELTKARSSNPAADLALRMFSYQVRKTIAGMAAVLNGLDLLVFTGGIGEHDSELRQDVTRHLEFCGGYQVEAMPSEEDLQIARITSSLLNAQPETPRNGSQS